MRYFLEKNAQQAVNVIVFLRKEREEEEALERFEKKMKLLDSKEKLTNELKRINSKLKEVETKISKS